MRRKAISVTVTTVILALTILIISSASAYLAVSIFEIQAQQTEFNQAKEVAVYLAQSIEDVAFKKGTSAYVRFNIRSSRPRFIENWADIIVKINGQPLINERLGAIMISGGSYVSTTTIEPLRGFSNTLPTDNWRDNSLIVANVAPLVWVYSEQKDGAKIWIDPARIKVSSLGVLNYISDEGGESVNAIEIKLIILKYGGAISGTTLNLKTLCRSVTIEQLTFPPGDITIDVTLNLNGGYSGTKRINTLYKTIVTVIVSKVEVYMLGG